MPFFVKLFAEFLIYNFYWLAFRYENSEHKDYVTDLSWNPLDCNEYLTASWDGTIKKHLISN